MSGFTKCGKSRSTEAAVKKKNTGKKKKKNLETKQTSSQSDDSTPPPGRKDLREQLKRQMEEKSVSLQLQLSGRVREAAFARQVDLTALSRDREHRVEHSKAMTVYRDVNKRVRTHTQHTHNTHTSSKPHGH